jgi:hypothetical protein
MRLVGQVREIAHPSLRSGKMALRAVYSTVLFCSDSDLVIRAGRFFHTPFEFFAFGSRQKVGRRHRVACFCLRPLAWRSGRSPALPYPPHEQNECTKSDSSRLAQLPQFNPIIQSKIFFSSVSSSSRCSPSRMALAKNAM